MSENERPADMPKLTDYRPTRYMLPTSHYDAAKADRAVKFIEMLRHTKGKWAGKRFWLLPWQEQIIRDLFGIVKENGKSGSAVSLVCRQRAVCRGLWRCGRSAAGQYRF